MGNSLYRPTLRLISRIAFFALIVIVVSHLVIFVLFGKINKKENLKINHDLMAQQVLHLIQVVINTPREKQKKIVESLEIPRITISLSIRPEHELRFTEISMWDILEKISNQSNVIRLSLLVAPNQWLNISAQIIEEGWLLQIFLLSLEVVLTLAVIFYVWSINRFTAPVREFALAAERLGLDLETLPLIEAGPPVVRDAVRAMNQMQNRIRSMVRDRTLMLAAISHDLRTPITRLKLRAQFIEDQELREKNIKDLDDMDSMIREILVLAKEGETVKQNSKIDLASLLSVLCDELNVVYKKISYQGPQNHVPVIGKAVSLNRLFTNIIVNAIKYGENAFVKLIDTKTKFVIITIEDNGCGIPENEIDAVFSPFYRADKSRSRETGGTGLGLTVAKEIVNLHQGEIQLKNRKSGGLQVTIKLPRA